MTEQELTPQQEFEKYLAKREHAPGPQHERRRLLVLNKDPLELRREGSILKKAIETALIGEDSPMIVSCQYLGQLEELSKKMSDFYAAFVNPARDDCLGILHEMKSRPDFDVYLFRDGEAYIERDAVFKRIAMIFTGDFRGWKNDRK